jgi:hypothetical protein
MSEFKLTCPCGAIEVISSGTRAWTCPKCGRYQLQVFDRPIDPAIERQAQEFFVEFVNASGTGGYIVPREIVTEEYRAGLKAMGYEEVDWASSSPDLP